MSSREFEDIIAEVLGDRAKAESLWSSIIDGARSALLGGRAVSLVHIGTITPYDKQASRFRDPNTNAMIEVPARRHLKFALSIGLKAELRNDLVCAKWTAYWKDRFDKLEAARLKELADAAKTAKDSRATVKQAKRQTADDQRKAAKLRVAAKKKRVSTARS